MQRAHGQSSAPASPPAVPPATPAPVPDSISDGDTQASTTQGDTVQLSHWALEDEIPDASVILPGQRVSHRELHPVSAMD